MKIRRPFWKSDKSELNCREVGRVLQWYLDGDLDEADIPKIQEHLEKCRECGLEADTYTSISESLAARGRLANDDVMQRLRAFTTELVESDGDIGR